MLGFCGSSDGGIWEVNFPWFVIVVYGGGDRGHAPLQSNSISSCTTCKVLNIIQYTYKHFFCWKRKYNSTHRAAVIVCDFHGKNCHIIKRGDPFGIRPTSPCHDCLIRLATAGRTVDDDSLSDSIKTNLFTFCIMNIILYYQQESQNQIKFAPYSYIIILKL